MSDPVDCMSNPQWLKICQHCRLLKCRQVGMRDEYVHNLRIQENGMKMAYFMGHESHDNFHFPFFFFMELIGHQVGINRRSNITLPNIFKIQLSNR